MNLSSGFGTQVFIYNLSNFVYNPSTQGAIESIGFSYSVIGSSPAVGGSFGDGLLLEQNGSLFVGSFTGVNDNVGWQTKSVSTVAGYPSLNGGVIDLSASGSPIRFGYLRTSTHSGGFFTSTTGTDNYSVTVNQVPIPEPLTILGTATAVGFGAFFKRKLAKAKESTKQDK